MGDNNIYYRRNLPHYQPLNAAYFVTFRLAGSLPKEVVVRLKEKQEENVRLLGSIKDKNERKQKLMQLRKVYFGKFDKFLDKISNGPHWLQDDSIAKIVAEAIQYRNGKDYELLAYCIMPNHVHMVFTVTSVVRRVSSRYIVTDILESLKWYTAKKCNKALHRKGQFWQHESYDHVIRSQKELSNIINYVLYNPVTASLISDWKQWKWSYCRDEC